MPPFLYGTLIITLYIAVAVGLMMLARKLVKIPDELCAKNGLDTILCPVSAMVVIIPMVVLL